MNGVSNLPMQFHQSGYTINIPARELQVNDWIIVKVAGIDRAVRVYSTSGNHDTINTFSFKYEDMHGEIEFYAAEVKSDSHVTKIIDPAAVEVFL